jgi:hypothetical protein
MPIADKDHTLTPDEIKALIKEGINLDESAGKMYIMRFGWNNQWNKAIDPSPFRIKPHLNDKLKNDAIGMPYVVPPFGTAKHLRKKDATEKDTISSILKIQSDYAIGDIVGTLHYPSDNIWLIVNVWPEFQAGVERGYYPPLCSPTFNILKETEDGVEDAQFLNLQAVPSSGYSAELTRIQPVCKNGLKECMAELQIMGAAGSLKTSNGNNNSFSNGLDRIFKSMSNQTGSEKTTESRVSDLESAVADTQKRVAAMEPTLNRIADKILNEGEKPKDPPADVKGAAGSDKLTLLQKDLEELKKHDAENTKLVKKYELQIRTAHATSIVERKTRGKTIDDKEKQKMIQDYISNQSLDLETLDNELKAAIPDATAESTIKGAYGIFEIPELKFDEKSRPKNSEMMRAIS